MAVPHSVYPFINGWAFGLFPLFGSYEKCCCEHSCTSVCVDRCFHFSWKWNFLPRSRIAGSDGNSIFNNLRNFQAVFQNGYTIWQSPQYSVRIPISPYPHQNLLFICSFMLALLVGVHPSHFTEVASMSRSLTVDRGGLVLFPVPRSQRISGTA